MLKILIIGLISIVGFSNATRAATTRPPDKLAFVQFSSREHKACADTAGKMIESAGTSKLVCFMGINLVHIAQFVKSQRGGTSVGAISRASLPIVTFGFSF